MKEAVVRPLLKKTPLDPANPANYCLVSNLLLLGKVIEIAAAEQLQAFLDGTLVLDLFQSDFASRYSDMPNIGISEYLLFGYTDIFVIPEISRYTHP